MNREQKAAAIAEIATQIDQADAIFAVDYRGISVEQVAELRSKLRDADATFKVVKNSLTERAADEAGVVSLKEHLAGPTALTFVRGDVAVAAKAIADYGRQIQLLPFKGGLMGADTLDVDQLRSLSRLPAREVLYGQLVGVVASPVSGLVRSLGALLGGLAVALGQVRDKKESGEIPAGEAPAESAQAQGEEERPAAAEATGAEQTPTEEAAPAEESDGEQAEPAAEAESAAQEEPEVQAEPEAEAEPEPAAEAEPEPEAKAEPEAAAQTEQDDKQADVSAQAEPEDAETNPTKED